MSAIAITTNSTISTWYWHAASTPVFMLASDSRHTRHPTMIMMPPAGRASERMRPAIATSIADITSA